MLKQRILTAIPLAALIIWGVLTQSSDVIFYALVTIIVISAWEWARLSGVENIVYRIVYAAVMGVLVFLSQQVMVKYPELLNPLLSFSVVFWLVAIYHMFATGPKVDAAGISLLKVILGVVVLLPPILALMQIREQSSLWLFYCLSIIWVADIGAYFSGKRFGKNKLAPHLSPGKTKEGLYGAVFATAVYSYLASLVFELQAIQTLLLLIIAALATYISVAGDLFFSLLKREQNLKDTGNILPGHGGILDRIDSVTSSAPLLALLLGQVIFNV